MKRFLVKFEYAAKEHKPVSSSPSPSSSSSPSPLGSFHMEREKSKSFHSRNKTNWTEMRFFGPKLWLCVDCRSHYCPLCVPGDVHGVQSCASPRHFISHAPQWSNAVSGRQFRVRELRGHIDLVACPSQQPITSSSVAAVATDRSRNAEKGCVMVKNHEMKNKKQRTKNNNNTATDRKLQIMFTIRSHVLFLSQLMHTFCALRFRLGVYFSFDAILICSLNSIL